MKIKNETPKVLNWTHAFGNGVPITVIADDIAGHLIRLPWVPRKGDCLDGELFGVKGEWEVQDVTYTAPDPLTWPIPHVRIFLVQPDEADDLRNDEDDWKWPERN